jgi:N-methylhydantoinase B
MNDSETNPPVIDPITLEIVAGTIESTRREMELQIERTARSVVIREGRDYRAGIFDRHGRNVSSASGAAHVDPILQNYAIDEVAEGDVFIWNDPFKSAGGLTHLPDLCVTQPIFLSGELVGYAQAFGHMTDVGGIQPGSVMIGATDIHQEGIIIPPVKLYSRGEVVEPLYRTILNNSRYPEDVRGDLDAEVMACRTGAARIQELFEQVGAPVVDACFEELLERCARALREVAFPQIPDGEYPFEDFVELAGAVPQEPREFIRLKVTMIKKDDHVTFDFNGTDAQSAASINIAGDERFYTKYVVSIFRNLVPDTVFNAGATRAISCRLPERSVLSAEYPASASCRAFTLFRLPELCLGALGRALPDAVPGSSDTRSVWGIATRNEDGEPAFFRDVLGGGGGGRREVDGSDALNGNVAGRSVPAEFIEAIYPMIVERDALAADSGGPGTHRGGFGCERLIRFLVPGILHVIDDRMQTQPWGIAGGCAGAGTRYVLNPGTDRERAFDRKIDAYPVESGDRLLAVTPGGGGWGDPLERDPQAVVADVESGLVSPEAAHLQYGVLLDNSNMFDKAATDALRVERRLQRGPRPLFDRGQRLKDLVRHDRVSLTVEDD